VLLHVRKLQQAETFALWLQKHAALLDALHVSVVRKHWQNNIGWRPAAVAALAAALQQAPGPSSFGLQLQSFTLQGAVATPDLLRGLPAAQLTQLRAKVDLCSMQSMHAVQALTALRSLEMRDPEAARRTPIPASQAVPMNAWPLAAGFQHLTSLHIGVLQPQQLLSANLQPLPNLQQLSVEVSVDQGPQSLALLASWLSQHAGIVSSLKLRPPQAGS
jgi:hypothetical protein